MRLEPGLAPLIKQEVLSTFGPDACVRLFGSRVDDRARGGDIDLHIETALDRATAFEREQKLFARLQRLLGERRIDIVTHRTDDPLRPIDREALRAGVPL
ncbi:MAG: nucleotidyltransferase domain-containing protein [Gammaproteobacteria bacterium]|nr:nucleotidyltransferase domain-containing protein [Gammaproteobacteria bacterium]